MQEKSLASRPDQTRAELGRQLRTPGTGPQGQLSTDHQKVTWLPFVIRYSHSAALNSKNNRKNLIVFLSIFVLQQLVIQQGKPGNMQCPNACFMDSQLLTKDTKVICNFFSLVHV